MIFINQIKRVQEDELQVRLERREEVIYEVEY